MPIGSAAEMGKATEPREARAFLRASVHWQSRLSEIESSFVGGSQPVAAVRDELRNLWPNAVKARLWCVDRAKSDVRAALMCGKLAGCAGQLLDQEQGRQTLIQWREDAVEAVAYGLANELAAPFHADLLHDLLGHLTYLGYLHMANGNMERARSTLERALREGRARGDRSAEGVAHLHLAMIFVREERPGEAEPSLRDALAVAASTNDKSLSAAAHNLMGVIASRPEDALIEYNEAARLFEELNRRSGACTAYANRAGILLDLNRRADAEQDLEKASQLAAELGAPHLRALCAVNQARLLAGSKDVDSQQIIDLLKRAKQEFEQIGDIPQLRRVVGMLEQTFRSALEGSTPLDDDQKSYALRRLAKLASERNDYEAAAAWLQQLLTFALDSHRAEEELEARARLGDAAVRQLKYQEAVDHLEQALSVFERFPSRSPYRQPECEVRIMLGQAYRWLGRSEEAAQQYELALAMAAETGDEEVKWRVLGNRALLYVDAGRYDRAIATLKTIIEGLQNGANLRLLGQAWFNLAYAHYGAGDLNAALSEGQEALRLLEMIGDGGADEVRRQMATWTTPAE